jgi:hypothetical protein
VRVELGDGLFFDPFDPPAKIGQFVLKLPALGVELVAVGEPGFD